MKGGGSRRSELSATQAWGSSTVTCSERLLLSAHAQNYVAVIRREHCYLRLWAFLGHDFPLQLGAA